MYDIKLVNTIKLNERHVEERDISSLKRFNIQEISPIVEMTISTESKFEQFANITH